MNNDPQKEYFQFAYQTGSDTWTHTNYHDRACEMIQALVPKNSLILELGCGRGLLLDKLLKLDYRCIGTDYIETIVNSVNSRIREQGYVRQGRAKQGESTQITFSDYSFDLACSFAHFQHIDRNNRKLFSSEIARVLKNGAYYLQASLSQNTRQFMGSRPKIEKITHMEKFGVNYYFTTKKEITDTFSDDFKILQQVEARFNSKSDPKDDIVFLFSLMQKK